jgi:hypothetical protein
MVFRATSRLQTATLGSQGMHARQAEILLFCSTNMLHAAYVDTSRIWAWAAVWGVRGYQLHCRPHAWRFCTKSSCKLCKTHDYKRPGRGHSFVTGLWSEAVTLSQSEGFTRGDPLPLKPKSACTSCSCARLHGCPFWRNS